MAAIVFDLDGTLIDSAPDIHAIANRVLEAEGHAPLSLLQVRDFIGNGAAVFVQRMRAARGISDAEQSRLYEKFLSFYGDAVDLTVIYPGVEQALQHLMAAGHRLGICTNKPIAPTRAVLRHLGLEGVFETVWGGDSLPVHKPDPAPLMAAFEALPEGPRLYVGDSGVDAETAARAGVPFLLFTEGYRKVPVAELSFDVAFENWDDLPGHVARMLAGGA